MSSEDDDIELRGQCMCKWPDCGDLFPDEKALVEHLATVHRGPKDGEQGDGKFRCRWPECYTKPTLRYGIGGLKRHLYTHTMAQPYMCSEPRCNVGYYKKVELDKHIQRHHAFEGADESDTDMEDFLAAAFENDQPTERRKDVSSSGSHHHRDDAAGLTNLTEDLENMLHLIYRMRLPVQNKPTPEFAALVLA
ncbi:hypothetical protein BKA62DRAFT_830751 [Auriculariales sp. MPI-PUGE-AT-0066]|nr:hypothetical protein BKA62DRAFT_830751 [Auriculariales sp. MPI-PUGE-AT-0066]